VDEIAVTITLPSTRELRNCKGWQVDFNRPSSYIVQPSH